MSEIICELIAHKAGFAVSTGNWIAPNGDLIFGKTHDEHHFDTIANYLGIELPSDNHLSWMNEQVDLGFIRLVFREDVMFQVGCLSSEDIWGDGLNYKAMMVVLEKLYEIDGDIHIFSRNFYVIGKAENIVQKSYDKLDIRVRS